MKNGGMGDGRFISLEQHFFWEGRPLSSPPISKDIQFVARPQQTFNVDFEVEIPDQEIPEGTLVYAFRCCYADTRGRQFEENVLWWYEGKNDKWWNNMNKVPTYNHIVKQLAWSP